MSSNTYFLLRTSVRACCSSSLGFDDARWFEYMLVLYCKSFRFCRLLPLWSNVFSACCSRNDTCKPTRQSAKTAVTKIFDVGRCSITLWSWRVGGEMIKPCIVHSAAKVHYHEYSIVYIRKFTFETSVNLAQIFLGTGHLYWLVCLWSGAFLGWIPHVQQSQTLGNNKMSQGKKGSCQEKKNYHLASSYLNIIFLYPVSAVSSYTFRIGSSTMPGPIFKFMCQN